MRYTVYNDFTEEDVANVDTINVHFRIFPEGDIIALWEDSYSPDGYCSSYQTVGQHSEASVDLIETLEVATPEQHNDLLRELQSIGYHVNVL